MGISTDAIFCYGVHAPEDFGRPWRDETGSYNAETKRYRSGEDVWLDKILGEGHRFKIETHCCRCEPMTVFAIAETVVKAHRGSPSTVVLPDEAVVNDYAAGLRVLTAKMAELFPADAEYWKKAEPGWILASDTDAF